MEMNTAVQNGFNLQQAIKSLKQVDTSVMSLDEYHDFNRSVLVLIELQRKTVNVFESNLSKLGELADAPAEAKTPIGRKHIEVAGQLFYVDGKGGRWPENQKAK